MESRSITKIPYKENKSLLVMVYFMSRLKPLKLGRRDIKDHNKLWKIFIDDFNPHETENFISCKNNIKYLRSKKMYIFVLSFKVLLANHIWVISLLTTSSSPLIVWLIPRESFQPLSHAQRRNSPAVIYISVSTLPGNVTEQRIARTVPMNNLVAEQPENQPEVLTDMRPAS